MTEITQQAALYCLRCQRYRPFRYVERRVLESPMVMSKGYVTRRPGRIIAHFYACTVCGCQQQWGCEG